MIALAYAGVHEIFQLALAAHEMGELDGLYCSIVDGPRSWGRTLRRLIPAATVQPLGWDAIPSDRMIEFPWPMVVNRGLARAFPSRRSEHFRSNSWFGRSAARWLSQRTAKVFIGVESCALECLMQAGEMGMARVLECPGLPSAELDAESRLAAERFGCPDVASGGSEAMLERKARELALADIVLCCSEFQRQRLIALHPQVKRSEVVPLWTDVDFWRVAATRRQFGQSGSPLRVLYAGAISLRKGVPYLLEAVEPLAAEVSLTLVGGVAPEMNDLLSRFRRHRRLPYVSKVELRSLYLEHDVLVMPTLGDSFGFVMLEAMASGIPVVASWNAGAPVPDDRWRVPAHDSDSIREQLLRYYVDRALLRHDGDLGMQFSQAFQPASYRARARNVFEGLLAA